MKSYLDCECEQTLEYYLFNLINGKINEKN